ncbi:MAG: hypothetical protein L0Y71_05035 [Gemmataceae bacterium]|nr:hypothetical protein [Gemmataceae bacterium]
MRTTGKRSLTWDILQPGSIGLFAALVLLWILVALGPEWESFGLRAAARLAGYGAFVAMLVPYLHILRRCFRYRQGPPMTAWLRWHIAAAYLAFLLVIVHSRGRANSPLTLALVWLTWIVMISGVVGFYGQKLLYSFLPRMVAREFGLERLEPQRVFMLQAAEELVRKKELAESPDVIRGFCGAAVQGCLARPLTFWSWVWHPQAEPEALSENWYQRTRSYADAKQQPILDDLWGLVELRRSMDLEYRLHQLGRLWLLVHGPAAWALLVLMIEHVALSMWYGGF